VDASAIVVIPTYKADLSAAEQISLTQSRRILGGHAFTFIAPDGLVLQHPEAKDIPYRYFDAAYFKGIDGYNQLLLSREFYDAFADHTYLLIAQLDTFVFTDRLQYWCGLGYDYIGAPWRFDMTAFVKWPQLFPFSYRHHVLSPLKLLTGKRYLVGNGGFSLRNADTARRILHDNPHLVPRFQDEAERNLLTNDGHKSMLNEDLFWALYVPQHVQPYRVPTYRRALQFAFEVDPVACYTDNRQQLPFGCHAWETHGLDFWRPFIKAYGHDF